MCLCCLLLWSSFSTVSSSHRELLQLCRIFSRRLCGISRSFGFYPYTWVSTSRPSLFNPSRCCLVFSPGSSPLEFSAPAFARYCLLSSHALLFLWMCWFCRLALPCHAFPILSMVYLPLSLLFITSLSFFECSSASVESPVPSATGSSLWAGSVPY